MLAGFITIDIYLTWRIISKLWVFNTAYIGLFVRSLLRMSLNQLELALKNTAFKSRTPVSMYQFDPLFNSIWEIIKTSHTQIFLFFSMMKRVRKGSDLPKKKWGSPSIQQKYSHTKLTQRSSTLCFVEFSNRCARLKMMWHARDQWIACTLEMRSSNGHERP